MQDPSLHSVTVTGGMIRPNTSSSASTAFLLPASLLLSQLMTEVCLVEGMSDVRWPSLQPYPSANRYHSDALLQHLITFSRGSDMTTEETIRTNITLTLLCHRSILPAS